MNIDIKNKDLQIGVFDSGIGGLTVLAELKRKLPNETFYYLGDTARVPYGTRSPETVIRYARSCTRFLIEKGIKLLVIACNTASSYALDTIKKEINIPVIGVVEPGAKAVVKRTKNKKVGIIGTEGTINSQSYEKVIKNIAPDIHVFSKACPLFVPLVEEGWTEGDIPNLIVREYLKPIVSKGIDTLLLACTHYPLLKKTIGETFQDVFIEIVDSAEETASDVVNLLQSCNLMREGIKITYGSRIQYFVTDAPEKFKKVGNRFLKENIEYVEWIDIPINI